MGKAANSAGRYDPVAGGNDGKRIVPAGLPDGAGNAAERFGELAIGPCLAAGDCADRSPGAAPEVASPLGEGEVESVVGVGQIMRQLPDGFFRGNAGCLQCRGVAGQEDDFVEMVGICDDAQRTKGGRQDCRKAWRALGCVRI